MGDRKNNKKKKKRSRKRATSEQIAASNEIREWAFGKPQSDSATVDYGDFAASAKHKEKKVLFDLHSHSTCSDGFLSPSALVERAHRRGVNVLALTDHDTMAGIPEALKAARKFGIRIIPGVEISAICYPSDEPVHILAYYSCCGPSKYEELESFLATIRDGRYLRAKNMLLKLKNLKMPLKWEQVAKISGNEVAPGRVHIARAMVEAGYVENIRQAFSRYLYDDGPAYSRGSEPPAEDVIHLILDTGGVATLAHPWALKDPISVVSILKTAGLHAVEVYRSDGKVEALSDLCDKYDLLKVGGSDYHGRGGQNESDLGSVDIPIMAVYKFLQIGRHIWYNAIRDTLTSFTNNPSDINLQRITRFEEVNDTKIMSSECAKDILDPYLSSWLVSTERQSVEFKDLILKLSDMFVRRDQ